MRNDSSVRSLVDQPRKQLRLVHAPPAGTGAKEQFVFKRAPLVRMCSISTTRSNLCVVELQAMFSCVAVPAPI